MVLFGCLIGCTSPVGEGESDEQGGSESESESESATGELTDTDTDTDDGTETSGPEPQCDPSAFTHAPDPVETPDYTLVPIDALMVEAELEFDTAARQATARASMVFQLGLEGGLPLLDLRQTPTEIWLDGEPVALDRFPFIDLGGGPETTLRALEVDLEPCSVHELTLHYPLERPIALNSREVYFYEDPPGLSFDFDMSDTDANRFLESWLPANLPWDRHGLKLSIHVVDERPHTLISNGEIIEMATNIWYVEFPTSTTSASPMLRIVPSDLVLDDTGELVTSDGRTIAWRIAVPVAMGYAPSEIVEWVRDDLDGLSALGLGPYPWDEVVVVLRPDNDGMEYRAAISTSLGHLEYQLAHLWWARGVEPASGSDGWFDEAFVSYVLEGPLEGLGQPWNVVLYDPSPFARKTELTAYEEGRMVFTGIAEVMGHDELMAAMRELVEQGVPRMLSTAELERHLHCASGEMPEIREIFANYVYTLGPPELLYGCD